MMRFLLPPQIRWQRGVWEVSQRLWPSLRKSRGEEYEYITTGMAEDSVHIALGKFVLSNRPEEAKETRALMRDVGIGASPVYLNHVLASLAEGMGSSKSVRSGRSRQRAQDMLHAFDQMVAAEVDLDHESWSWLVYAQAHDSDNYGPDGALETIKRLKGLGLPLHCRMFNGVLEAYLFSFDRSLFDKAMKLWLDMHMEPGLELDKDSFTLMLKHCALTSRAERAFFYVDEMRSLDLTPTIDTYRALIRACAEAPHWVPGYEDIIFDALYQIEGAELEPTVEIYDAIIYAFGRAGDATAAEYYFWEMQWKGLLPTTVTYNNLLNAYAKAQAVGAARYGRKGRYVRPAARDPTPDEQAIMDAGPGKVREALSEGCMLAVMERG